MNFIYNFEAVGYEKTDPDDMKLAKSLSKQYPGKVLRFGYRSLPNRPRKGREMCLRTQNEISGVNEYKFRLSFDSEAPLDQPDIYIAMTTAGLRSLGLDGSKFPQAFFDEAEALALWDALISTIRPYPGSV